MNFPDYSNAINIFQDGIDSLIDNLGKNVTLVFRDTTTNVNTSFNDPIRNKTIRMPDFKKSPSVSAPTRSENTKVIKALISYNPKDFKNFGLNLNENDVIVRLKTYLTILPDLVHCDYMIPSSDVQDALLHKFKLIRAPVPRGLGEDRYAYTYWKSSYGNTDTK